MSEAIQVEIPEVEISQKVLEWISRPKKLLINGEWVDAESGETFEVYNPANGKVIAHVAKGGAADIEEAVGHARKTFDEGASSWRSMTPSERGKIVWKIGDLIQEHADVLAELESADNGKPMGVAKVADVALAADLFHYMAGWATKIEGNTIPISVPYAPGAQFHAFTLKEPVGVVGQIIPWNFPLLMAAWKLGPALTTGNVVVLKPAEQTPLTALYLGELLLEAGVPAGVVNIVTGFGDAGAALAAHNSVDKVAFTGSTEVGKMIVEAASGNLKKLTLELGGKSPNVIYKDVADLDAAIAGAANAIFFNHGQCCCAGSRLIVEKEIYDDVVKGVAEHAQKIKLGPGLANGTEMGPLVSDEQLARVTGFLNSGKSDGACMVAGGSRFGERGYFVEPTVITGANADMQIVKEEIFGPVVVAESFTDEAAMISSSNNTSFGLAAAVWTKDIAKAHRVAKSFRAGTVWVNCYNVFDAALPFGGYKESGWGREMGHEVLENYLETKSVVAAL